MGIRGFYSFCSNHIPNSFKTVNVIEEIHKYRLEFGNRKPLIVINLWTLSYTCRFNAKDRLCGDQLNKVKYGFENFVSKLIDAGARVIFVFKKIFPDYDFLYRQMKEYHIGCSIIEEMGKVQEFEKLENIITRHGLPYNIMVLVGMIQSARKFGKVLGFNSVNGKPTVQQAHFADMNGAWVFMGLETYNLLLPGKWKMWTDVEITMDEMIVREYNKDIIVSHFDLDYYRTVPLYGALIGDLQSSVRNVQKVTDYFGQDNLFINAADFIKRFPMPITDKVIEKIVSAIFGEKFDPGLIEDFRRTIKSYKVQKNTENINTEVLDMVKDDFMSFAEEILINLPVFISPVHLDFRKKDMKSINELALPWIQRTAGVLLKNVPNPEPRKLILLERHQGKLIEVPIENIYPDFEVPPLKNLLAGDMSAYGKMELLFWVVGLPLIDDAYAIPEAFLADIVILLYLIKNESLTLLEARCILKAHIDAINREISLKASDYPETVNERAFRCSHLYSKMYFVFHSCMSCLGFKNLLSEYQFDSVYFQKMHALNAIEDASKSNLGNETVADATATNQIEPSNEVPDSALPSYEIIAEFLDIIKW